MKNTARTATFATTLVALVTLSFSPATMQAATVKPKPSKPVIISPEANPVPVCPPGDPNGCGIYSN